MNEYEIVERSSGYWIVDGIGYVNGPYSTVEEEVNEIYAFYGESTVEEASKDVPSGQLQYPLPLEDTNE